MARGADRARAPRRAVELRDVLPRRGRGRRRPRAVHRRRPARGAEVLPRHPAGRRGAPRDLLQALHARGRRARRRHDRGRPARRREPELTWGFRKTFALLDESPASCAATARAPRSRGRDDVPLRRRGAARPARPALHLRLPRARATCCPASATGMQQRRARRAAPHRLRRQAAARPRARGPRGAARRSPTCSARVTPFSLAVFIPPGWDRSYTECFGFTLEEIYTEGARSFEAKLRSAGLPLESLPGPSDLPAGAAAARARRVRAGDAARRASSARRNGAPPRDPASMALLFDIGRAAPSTTAPRPTGPFTVQWEFAGRRAVARARSTTARPPRAPGRAPHVDLELRCRFEDWVDIVAGRLDPRRAVATGRLRPQAQPRALWRARGLFTS